MSYCALGEGKWRTRMVCRRYLATPTAPLGEALQETDLLVGGPNDHKP